MNRNFATYGAFLVLFVVRVYSVFYIELNFSEKLCGFIFLQNTCPVIVLI